VSGVLQIPPLRLRLQQGAGQAQWQHQRPCHLGAMADAVNAPDVALEARSGIEPLYAALQAAA
jgi:hypothetical protein